MALQEVWWVESKLLELADILPGFSSRLDNMKADLVVQLISDIQVRHTLNSNTQSAACSTQLHMCLYAGHNYSTHQVKLAKTLIAANSL